MSDAANAIRNGFNDVFGDEKTLLMCYYHVIACVKKNLIKLKISPDIQIKIKSDIEMLSQCNSPVQFKKASELFKRFWRPIEPAFVTYMESQWLSTHQNWYHGFGNVPTTDNALESFNDFLKKTVTLRQRLPLTQFFIQLEKAMNYWSSKLEFITIPKISMSLWTTSCQWNKENVKIKSKKLATEIHYNVPAKSASYPRNDSYFKSDNWDSFDDFKNRAFKLYLVKFPNSEQNWMTGSCTCVMYLKQFVCKHLIGIATRNGWASPPMEAYQVPIGKTRGRGRPKKLPRVNALSRE